MRALSLLFAALTLSLVSPSAAAPPSASSSSTALPPGTVPTKKLVDVKTAVRVRFELSVKQTTDGVGADSEDEIYYFVVQPQQGDTLKLKEVRRTGDPNVFEMGKLSDSKLSRWLFRGEVSIAKPMRLGLVIAEQDSSDALDQGSSGGGSFDMYDPALLPGMFEAKSRIKDRDHQELSFVQIVATGNKLTVRVRDSSASSDLDKVVSSDATTAKIELNGPGKYVLRVFLEPDSGPAPKGRRYLGLEDDDCGPSKSLLVKSPNGDVSVGKGATKVVAIGAQEFKWYCGGSDESSVARPGTDFLEVVRSSTSDTVLWKCFKSLTLSPDVSW